MGDLDSALLLHTNQETLLRASSEKHMRGKSKSDKEMIRLFRKSIAKNALCAPFFEEYLNIKLTSLGKKGDALKVKKSMGVINNWHFIGPFENSAGSGFNTLYAPEKEIILDSTYKGMSDKEVTWRSLENSSNSPWIWLENHVEEFDPNAHLDEKIEVEVDFDVPAFLESGEKIFIFPFASTHPTCSILSCFPMILMHPLILSLTLCCRQNFSSVTSSHSLPGLNASELPSLS